MRCFQFEELLPDYLQQNLDNEQLSAIERHMEQCPECREQVALWKKLSSLPEEQPSPMLRRHFDAMLEAFQQGRWQTEGRKTWASRWQNRVSGWYRAPWAQAAFAMVLLVAGFAVGRYLNAPPSSAQELASLHKELTGMRQLVVLSLLQQQSASERLQGVTWSLQASRPDPEILSALLHTLRFDTSVDVRLAALDALKRYNNQPEVRKGLMDALQGQQSPLVQIALIDLLVELREASAVERLKTFEKREDVNPTVRQRAEWGISQLSRG